MSDVTNLVPHSTAGYTVSHPSRHGIFASRMWSYSALLKHARRRPSSLVSLSCISRPVVTSLAHSDTIFQRYFSSSKNNNNNKDHYIKTTRGRNNQAIDRKENFARKILKPASQGELLKKHESGIPKLASRKHKPRLHPSKHKNNPLEDRSIEWEERMDNDEGRKKLFQALSSNVKPTQGPEEEDDEDLEDYGPYYAPELLNDDKYFWREEEYESLGDDIDWKEEGEEFVQFEYDEKDTRPTEFQADDDYEDIDFGDDDDEEDEEEIKDRREGRMEAWKQQNPEEQFFYGQNDVIELASLPESAFPTEEELARRQKQDAKDQLELLPLRDHGPNLDDFLEAMIEHPTKYAQVHSPSQHPESLREPKPCFPKNNNRLNPTADFVESHKRFLYVTGLPPLVVNGEPGDLENPIHRDLLQKTIARLVGIDSSHVFPANINSAFCGFDSPRELANAIANGPNEKFIFREVSVSKYRPEDGGEDFGKDSPECIVTFQDMPPGNTSVSLARDLFPEGTELGDMYGGLSPDDIHFTSKTSVLIRFKSAEQAESAIDSSYVRDRLKEYGQYRVRYLRARRELVHAGFTGPNRSHEKRKMGFRLIVDGDMPSKTFFLSHARAIHLRNLDPTLTKEDITQAFQPFSNLSRDVSGSIEFVTCEAGLPTGHVYVGFDQPGEAEACIRACKGQIQLGDRRAVMRLVNDRQIPGFPLVRPEKRPERSEKELLDDLNNWEKYVDPADLKELEEAGIPLEAVNEALRGIRYSNPTFGALDSAVRTEALQPEKMTGELYKELVQMYVSTLKECIATPENVGEMYELVHYPDEPIDLSIFEEEKERQKKLKELRAKS